MCCEAHADVVVVHADLVMGHHGDAAEGLGIQQHEASGHSVDELEGVVVEEPTGDQPAILGVASIAVVLGQGSDGL